MDENFVINCNLDNVYDLGFKTFRGEVVRHIGMQKHIQQCLLDLMSRERRGEVIHKKYFV